jgi:hypothetical protein
MKVHVIQIVHIINAILGVVVLAMLISANTKMKSFIANGSELSGFGEF